MHRYSKAQRTDYPTQNHAGIFVPNPGVTCVLRYYNALMLEVLRDWHTPLEIFVGWSNSFRKPPPISGIINENLCNTRSDTLHPLRPATVQLCKKKAVNIFLLPQAPFFPFLIFTCESHSINRLYPKQRHTCGSRCSLM